MDDTKLQIIKNLQRASCEADYNMRRATDEMEIITNRRPSQQNEYCKRTYEYIIKAEEERKKVIDLYNQLCEMEGYDKL